MKNLSKEQQLLPLTSNGELASILLRLHVIAKGEVAPGAGHQIHAAFLDLVRQCNPDLAEWLHTPNMRRPYTLSFLHGFNHLTSSQREEIQNKGQSIPVSAGQTCWLRITTLDERISQSLMQILIVQGQSFRLAIGGAHFAIGRVLSLPEDTNQEASWAAISSFAELRTRTQLPPGKRFRFEFVTPTTFSLGQSPWGRRLHLFPDPKYVFESLAQQWERFAPEPLRLAHQKITVRDLATWCENNVAISHYTLHTGHLSAPRFGFDGFQGSITYEVKGESGVAEARWLTPLAHFALFSGLGYKTTMGMGQTRCLLETYRAKEE